MITTLSALKEMILANSGEKLYPLPRGNQNIVPDSADYAASAADRARQTSVNDAVSVELSASHDVFKAVDEFFDLGSSGRFDSFHGLSRDDKEQFVKIVAELAKSGYIGYEELIVNKKVERHEIISQIGDRRVYNARVYDRSKYPNR